MDLNFYFKRKMFPHLFTTKPTVRSIISLPCVKHDVNQACDEEFKL